MFHVERLVHAASDLDAQVFVNGVFRNFHFVPLGKLLFIATKKEIERKKKKYVKKKSQERKKGATTEQTTFGWCSVVVVVIAPRRVLLQT